MRTETFPVVRVKMDRYVVNVDADIRISKPAEYLIPTDLLFPVDQYGVQMVCMVRTGTFR